MIDLVIYFDCAGFPTTLKLRAYNEATADAYITFMLTCGAHGIVRTDRVLQ